MVGRIDDERIVSDGEHAFGRSKRGAKPGRVQGGDWLALHRYDNAKQARSLAALPERRRPHGHPGRTFANVQPSGLIERDA